MKKTLFACFTLALILPILFPLALQAQDETERPKMSEAEMMAYMMQANMVGKKHQLIKDMEGTWEETVSFYMSPDQPPMEFTTTSTNTVTMGGRFMESRSSGNVMGQEFERLGIMGHDNRLQKYTFYGFDTFGTYAIYAEGEYNEDTKEIVMYGTEADPNMPHDMEFKIIFRFVNKNKREFEIWFLTGPNGEEVENLTVKSVSKRKK